jgi:hypothetical protein
VGKNVLLDVNACRHFGEFQTFLHKAEHAALGYVQYVLSPQVRVFPAESAVFDLAHKLFGLALAIDVQLAIRNRKLKQRLLRRSARRITSLLLRGWRRSSAPRSQDWGTVTSRPVGIAAALYFESDACCRWAVSKSLAACSDLTLLLLHLPGSA